MSKEQVFYLCVVAILTLLRASVPFLTNPQWVFGQVIPEEKVKDVDLVNNKFAYGISVALVSVVMASYIIRGNSLSGYIFPAMSILMISADALIYFVYFNKTRSLKESKNWGSLATTPKNELKKTNRYTLPIVLLFAAIMIIGWVVGIF